MTKKTITLEFVFLVIWRLVIGAYLELGIWLLELNFLE